MIDISSEELISLNEAAAILPRRRAGRKCAVSTLHRWRLKGIKGVCLETVKIGGVRMTSREALERFIRRVSSDSERPVPEYASETPEARERELARIDAALAKEGI